MPSVHVRRITWLASITCVIAACSTAHAPAPMLSPSPHAPSPTPGPRITVTGLFREPRPSPAGPTRSLGAPPANFAPWDGTSTMIYDVVAGTDVNLGPGSLGRFSPDSTRMVWISRTVDSSNFGDARIIDLRTMEQRSLGPGRLAIFADNDHVEIAGSGGVESELVDLRTGARTPVSGLPNFQGSDTRVTPDGYELKRTYLGESSFTRSLFTVTDPADGSVILEVDAYQVAPAGPGALALATEPLASGEQNERGYAPATTNIFLVSIATGEATFIATSPAYPPNWPIIANERYVVWTEDYCGAPQGTTRIYERASGVITALDATLWLDRFTPSGLLAAGAFGAKALIDPATLEYAALLPAGGDKSWSPDYRYASMEVIGHGGLCG